MLLRKLAPFFFALFFPALALAASKGPLELLKDAQKRIDTILAKTHTKGSKEAEEQRKKLEAEADGLISFEELSKRALGKKWETGTPDQQKEFVGLFSKLVRKQYLDQAQNNGSKGFALSWGAEDVKGTEASVTSTLKGKTAEGKPVDVKVTYQLVQVGAEWKVFNFIVDDSNLLDTYKDSFKKSFKEKKDFEGVLKTLREKTK